MSDDNCGQAGFDQRSFEVGRHVGEIGAWCEAIGAGVKPMGLSAPFPPGDYDVLLPFMERAARQHGVCFRLEQDLCTTDLFKAVDMTGLWVFLIARDESILRHYSDLKEEVSGLEQGGEYEESVRREQALRLGKLLGYSDAALMEMLSR